MPDENQCGALERGERSSESALPPATLGLSTLTALSGALVVISCFLPYVAVDVGPGSVSLSLFNAPAGTFVPWGAVMVWSSGVLLVISALRSAWTPSPRRRVGARLYATYAVLFPLTNPAGLPSSLRGHLAAGAFVGVTGVTLAWTAYLLGPRPRWRLSQWVRRWRAILLVDAGSNSSP